MAHIKALTTDNKEQLLYFPDKCENEKGEEDQNKSALIKLAYWR